MERSFNEGTSFGDISAARAPVLPPIAWQRAMQTLARALPAGRTCPVLAGVVIQAGVRPAQWETFVFPVATAESPASATLGRHGNCDAKLPAGSLRQVVLLGWADGELWALDLNTETGMQTPLGDATRLHGNGGTLLFGAGGAWVAVVVVPPGVLVEAVPSPGIPASLGTECLAAPALGGADLEFGRPPATGSLVAYVDRVREGNPRALGPWAVSTLPVFAAADGTYRNGRGEIAHPGTWGRFELEPQDLARGVLIGRYERCASALLTDAWDGVSRVQALLISRRGKNLAVDLASTNGTDIHRGIGAERVLPQACNVAIWKSGDQLVLGDVLEFDLVVKGDQQ
jgi:hypothetical protein